jgi:hypothetical protein
MEPDAKKRLFFLVVAASLLAAGFYLGKYIGASLS